MLSEASGIIKAAKTLTIGIEMLADALGAAASERMASGAGRAAGLTLVESVVIKMKIQALKDDVVMEIMGSDWGKEDGWVDRVVDVVGGLVVEKQRHGETVFVQEIRLNIDAVHEDAIRQIQLTYIAPLVSYHQVGTAVIVSESWDVFSSKMGWASHQPDALVVDSVLANGAVLECCVESMAMAANLGRLKQGDWVTVSCSESIDNLIVLWIEEENFSIFTSYGTQKGVVQALHFSQVVRHIQIGIVDKGKTVVQDDCSHFIEADLHDHHLSGWQLSWIIVEEGAVRSYFYVEIRCPDRVVVQYQVIIVYESVGESRFHAGCQ